MIRRIFHRKNKDWHVEIATFGSERFFSITDHNIWNRSQSVFETILDLLLREYRTITLCQYIDEGQGMLDDKSQLFHELSNQFGLQIRMTKHYETEIQLSDQDKETEYIIHLQGQPNIHWLKKIIRFGGTSLSNIMYDTKNFDQNWPIEIAKRNSIFIKWYWNDFKETDVFQLWKQTGFICFTSDSHLSILLGDEAAEKLLLHLQEIADQNSYNLIFDR